MLLTIDIGNSNITSGLFDKNELIEHFSTQTAIHKTDDDYKTVFRNIFSGLNLDAAQINKIVLSSVVPTLTQTISKTITKLTGKKPLIISTDLYPKLNIKINNPQEIGTDLVANAVAAHDKFIENCIVVDFGTALSFTAIKANGNLLGVTIAPGLEIAMNSLSQNTALLPAVDLIMPKSCIGKNTIHAIQAGLLFGYKGLIEALVHNISKEFKGDIKVIATGGLAPVIVPFTSCFNENEPFLTLNGLRIISNIFD